MRLMDGDNTMNNIGKSFIKLTPRTSIVNKYYVNTSTITFIAEKEDCSFIYFNDGGVAPLEVMESGESIMHLIDLIED